MRYLMIAALLFGLGGCFGSRMTSPEVEFIEGPARTKIVEAPAPDPVTVEVLPESCMDALVYAEKIVIAGKGLYARGDKQIALISDVRRTLAAGENLSDLEEQQRQLKGHAVGDLYDLTESVHLFEKAQEKCEEESP